MPKIVDAYVPDDDRASKTAREKFKEDKALLWKMLPDFFIATKEEKLSGPEDGLTGGLRVGFTTKKLSLWVVFATQIYLDIHHVLRQDVHAGFMDMSIWGKNISDDFNSYKYAILEKNFKLNDPERWDNPVDNPRWPVSKIDDLLQLVTDIENMVRGDVMYYYKKSMEFPPTQLGEYHQFMKSHPWRCGLFAYRIRARHQELCIALENAYNTLLFSFHLYKVFQIVGLIDEKWEDMEVLMTRQK